MGPHNLPANTYPSGDGSPDLTKGASRPGHDLIPHVPPDPLHPEIPNPSSNLSLLSLSPPDNARALGRGCQLPREIQPLFGTIRSLRASDPPPSDEEEDAESDSSLDSDLEGNIDTLPPLFYDQPMPSQHRDFASPTGSQTAPDRDRSPRSESPPTAVSHALKMLEEVLHVAKVRAEAEATTSQGDAIPERTLRASSSRMETHEDDTQQTQPAPGSDNTTAPQSRLHATNRPRNATPSERSNGNPEHGATPTLLRTVNRPASHSKANPNRDTSSGPTPGTRLLVDHDGIWRSREAALLLTIRDNAPGVAVRSFTTRRNGYLISVTDVVALEVAVAVSHAFGNCTIERPTRPPRQMEVTLNVPTSIQTSDVVRDLRAHLGDNIRAARRLHNSTNGRIDRTRPLPRVVVSVLGEKTAEAVRQTSLFGVLVPPRSKPREIPQVTQCRRCFRLGHRSGTCTSLPRCIRCGSETHQSATCPTAREDVRCIGCEGSHAVTWAGCPLRLRLARKMQKDAQATKGKPSLPADNRPKGTGAPRRRDVTFAAVTAHTPPQQAIELMEVSAPVHTAVTISSAALAADRDPWQPPTVTPMPLAEAEATSRPPNSEIEKIQEELDAANRARREAKEDHDAFNTKETKRLLNRANRLCAKLRKKRTQVAAEQPAPPVMEPEIDRPDEPAPSADQPPSTSSPSPPPLEASPSSQDQQEELPPAQPAPRSPTQHQPSAAAVAKAASLVRSIRSLGVLSRDPSAALTHVTDAMAALASLLDSLADNSPNN